MWSEIILLFKNYIGNGWAAGLFAAAFLYLLHPAVMAAISHSTFRAPAFPCFFTSSAIR